MTGPAPAVAAARLAVRRTLQAAARAPRANGGAPARVVVGCSGGADSLALAAATAFVAPRLGIEAGAVVVDHGLQPGSDAVAQRAAEQCRALGLGPVETVRVSVTGRGGLEAAARDARRGALLGAARRQGAQYVLLGHTLDDQAETVLLGLARGSGARSLCGMAAIDGPWVRPFLLVRRSHTEAVCAALGLDVWHDPTNTPEPGDAAAPVRSRLRAQAMPVLREVLGDHLDVALARSAHLLRDDEAVLAPLATELLQRALLPPAPPGETGESPRLVVDCAVVRDAPAGLRRRALKQAAELAGTPQGAVTFTHVEAVDQLVTAYHGQGPAALPGRIQVVRKCGRLLFLGTAHPHP